MHVHTVLSPCGDLGMSPSNIIREASLKGIDILGITDHNSTLQCGLMMELGEKAGICVIPGAEVTSREEVHCLVYFPDLQKLSAFQQYLDEHLPHVINDPKRFGYQVVVDQDENITYTEERLLITALDCSLNELSVKVVGMGGLFIPAHVDRMRYGLIGQLGFIPSGLQAHALEISSATSPSNLLTIHPEIYNYKLVRGSDAHYIEDIGKALTAFYMEQRGFDGIGQCLLSEDKELCKILT